jgi:CRP-like cAMP-binding protein
MSVSGAVQPSILGLRANALLEGLPEARVEGLARECGWRHYDAGQQVISRESEDRDVFLIVSGRLRVTTYSPAGRQVTFRDQGRGDYVGELAAIDGLPRSADIVAIESTLVASMSPGVFWRLLRDEPIVAERVLRRLAGLVRRLTDRVIDLSTHSVQQRIVAELLRLAKEAGIDANMARIEPAPKHADLASQLSTYREQVTRELSALVKAGLLERAANALVIRDVARLDRMVREAQAAG